MPSAALAFSLFIVVLGGVAVAVQAPINARLGAYIGGPILAACVSFAVGLVVLLVVVAVRSDLPRLANIGTAPLWTLIGGAFGAFFIFAVTWAVPKVGSATMISAVVFGQLAAALVIDRLGLFGLDVVELSPYRLAGVALIFVGVLLTRF